MASAPIPGRRASYKITLDADYLRAELQNRRTAEEMQLFLNTVAGTSKVLGCRRFLISVHSAIPMSMLERSVFLARLNQLGSGPVHRVAVLRRAWNSGTADEDIEPFAQQQGVNVRYFADEAAALQWVRDRRHGQERRNGREQHDRQSRRLGQDRRLGRDRRYGQANPSAF